MMLKIVGFLMALLVAVVTPVRGQSPFSQIQIGGHVGMNASDGPFEDWRVGVHGIAHLRALPVAINGAVSLYVPDDVGDNVSVGGQQLWLSALAFPFGSVWYLGTGVTYLRAAASAPAENVTVSVSVTERFHMVQTGFSVPIGRVSLFGEMQLLNLLASNSGVGVLFFAGASLTL